MKSHNTIHEIPRERKFIRNKKWVRSDTIPNETANKKWIRTKVLQNEAVNGSRSLTISSSFSGGAVAQQRSTEQQQPALKRAGKHKLILPSTSTSTTGGYRSTVFATSSNSMLTSKNRKRRQPPSMCTIDLVVKRIPLNDNTTASGDTASSINVRNLDSPPTNGAQHDVDKLPISNTNAANLNSRLTDFAYRCLPAAATTTTLRSHDATNLSSNLSFNRGRDSKKVIQSKTAQLIRVKPGEDPQQVFVIGAMKKQASPRSATAQSITSIPTGNYKFMRNQTVPSYNRTAASTLQHKSEYPTTSQICPEVMSGKECCNVYCTKRHDIPRTMTTPICTFFQRHGGQCHKGDSCRFLHVKLNPQAEICSVFQIYGHCSAGESCPRKHIRASHPNANKFLKNDSRITNTQVNII